MAKDWQKKEITYLKRYSETKTLAELAERFDAEPGEVSAQLAELGLRTKDSAFDEPIDLYDDPVVESYSEGLEQLQKGNWKQAQKTLEEVVEASDLPEVTEKARQMLKVCAARLSDDADDGAGDPFLLAVYHKNQGRYDDARKLCKKHANDDRFAYLEASIHALEENADEARASLTRATEMNPKNRVYAYHDPDFDSVRESPELETFFQPS